MTDSSRYPSTLYPSEWETTSFGAIAEFINGYAFKPSDWSQFGLPIIRIAQMLDDQAAVDHYEGVLPEHYRIDNGDLVFSWSATLAIVLWNRGPAWLNQHLFKVVSKTDNVVHFLHHLINFHIEKLAAQSHGTTMRHIKREDLLPYRVLRPKPPEQFRIAAVLNTVDEAIAKTEAVIAKLKQVRAGLLHDVITRGLDEHGQFRDPIAHPEQFQDSPLGCIPREWKVCGVLDAAPIDRQAILTGPFGAQLGQADFVRDGIPVLRIGNVQSGYIDLSDLQFVTEEKAQTLERFRIKCGDLLFARQGATTGRNALADERVEGYVINYHIIRVAVNRGSCSPVFLHALFNSENVQRQINRDKGRGTREGINTGEITALRFALPPIDEQHRAVAVMRAQSRLVETEVELLGKLYLIKSGLMADLLTGRVRVPEEIAVAP